MDNIFNSTKEYKNIDTSCNCYGDIKCKLVTKCCNKIYCCYNCHNRNEDHKVYLNNCEIQCKNCTYIQKISNKCEMCDIQFAKYFCKKCNIWNNNEMYHCDKCGNCKVGKKEDNFHCDICGLCYSNKLRNHKCIPNIIKDDCVICLEKLKHNDLSLSRLPCGHILHTKCLNEMKRCNIKKCPKCNCSINIKKIQCKEVHNVPEEYRSWKLENLCNDCNAKSTISFRFDNLYCVECESVNVKTINVIQS